MTLAEPLWLLLLLLIPLFVIGAILTARLRRKQWAVFAAPRLRQKLLRRSSPLPQSARPDARTSVSDAVLKRTPSASSACLSSA